jgi:hypothetical protein
MEFNPGEAVSQRHVGHALATWFDALITVDPHLHRVATLDEVVPGRRGVALRPRRCWAPLSPTRCPARCCWRPTKKPASGCAPRRRPVAWTTRCATSSARATTMCRWPCPMPTCTAAPWCCWTTWPAPAARWWPRRRAPAGRGAASVDVAVTHGLFIGDALDRCAPRACAMSGAATACRTPAMPSAWCRCCGGGAPGGGLTPPSRVKSWRAPGWPLPLRPWPRLRGRPGSSS